MLKKIASIILLEISTPAWKKSVQIWILLNLLLGGLGIANQYINGPVRPANYLGEWTPSPVESGWRGAYSGVWLRWDANYYVQIADESYSQEVLSVFFPLYPMLGRVAGWLLGGDELVGLLLVSRLAFLFALVVLFKMTAGYFGDEVATFTIVFTALYPMGVYWLAPYPLSLALLLTLLSLRCAMQKRWLLASLAGLAAGLTHGTTIPLALGLLAVWFLQIRKEKCVWWLLPATATPLLGTALFLAWRIANGFPDFSALQAKYWTRVIQPPWMIVGDFQRFFTAYSGHADGWVNLLLFLFALWMTVVTTRKLPAVLAVYLVTMMFFLCSTAMYNTPFGSMGRFLLTAFPIFIAASLTFQGKRSRMAAITISLFTMLFLAIVYFQWGWLA